MPRRKILSVPEELNYHFDCILKNVNKPIKTRANGSQLICYVAALAAKAHMNKVDLGPVFQGLVARLSSASRTSLETPVLDITETKHNAPAEAKEPLTIQPPDDIFGGLEGINES